MIFSLKMKDNKYRNNSINFQSGLLTIDALMNYGKEWTKNFQLKLLLINLVK
jgi:hypothetical protein